MTLITINAAGDHRYTPEALARVAMLIEDALRVVGPARPEELCSHICRPAGMVDAAIERSIQAGELRLLRSGHISIVLTGAAPTPAVAPAAAPEPKPRRHTAKCEPTSTTTSSEIYCTIVAAGCAGMTTADLRHELGAPDARIRPRLIDLVQSGLIRRTGPRPARLVAVADLDKDQRAAIKSLKTLARRMLIEIDRKPLTPHDDSTKDAAKRLHARRLIEPSPAGWVLSDLGRAVLPCIAASLEAAR